MFTFISDSFDSKVPFNERAYSWKGNENPPLLVLISSPGPFGARLLILCDGSLTDVAPVTVVEQTQIPGLREVFESVSKSLRRARSLLKAAKEVQLP